MYLFLQRSSFWATDCMLDGGLEEGGKILGKTWNDLLAEIFIQDLPRKSWGSRIPRRGVKKREGEREKREVLIQATEQGKISALSRCQLFRWISDFREETIILSNLFHLFLVRLLKCGPKLHCYPLEDRSQSPCLAPFSTKMA